MQAANRPENPVVKAVIFDMDNTLFDFVGAQLAACGAVLAHLGSSCDPADLFSYFRRPLCGFESHDNIRDFLCDTNVFSESMFETCCTIYEETKVASITPYPHISEMLRALQDKGLLLAVVTDARNGNAMRRLDRAGLTSFFSAIISVDMSGAPKPAPDSFLLALRTLGVQPFEAVLVGDSLRRDIEPAQKLGMITVYAAYGDRNVPDAVCCCADYCVRNVPEIAEVIKAAMRHNETI